MVTYNTEYRLFTYEPPSFWYLVPPVSETYESSANNKEEPRRLSSRQQGLSGDGGAYKTSANPAPEKLKKKFVDPRAGEQITYKLKKGGGATIERVPEGPYIDTNV